MLTSRQRSTGAGAGQGPALPRRVPGASQRESELVAGADAAHGGDTARGATVADLDDPDVALDAADLDLADLPDVSGLLKRLVEERIPMALMIDLVNPSGPGSEADGARSDVE